MCRQEQRFAACDPVRVGVGFGRPVTRPPAPTPAMPTVQDVIRRLLPTGTNAYQQPQDPQGPSPWERVPGWPPDAFAVAATLVNMSGCYSRPRYAGGVDEEQMFIPDAVHFARLHAERWAQLPAPEDLDPAIQHLWGVLWDLANGDVADATHPRTQLWCDAAFKLLVLADEASAGVGFVISEEDSPIAAFVLSEYEADSPRQLRDLPYSLCIQATPSEACVQPKARTAQLGCTLRSLTHHLALLPPKSAVCTNWGFSFDADRQGLRPLNLLLVPFPYRIDPESFVPGPCVQHRVQARLAHHAWEKAGCPAGDGSGFWNDAGRLVDGRSRFFGVEQTWLRDNGAELAADQISVFLRGLLQQVRGQGQEVNGIVLPEFALDRGKAAQIAELLAAEKGLELFVAGIAAPAAPRQLVRNCVYTCVYDDQGILTSREQSKHHRWKLDRSQIECYRLDDRLPPDVAWWEGINIEDRSCGFLVFRPGACLATLICEDLGRIEPVQTAIRAVGPNLVIALLMDGPQLAGRWPARYATVLADDPGCSVLTLTSLGLMRRSWKSGKRDPSRSSFQDGMREAREIALWKEQDGSSQELWLPSGSHALLLNLHFQPVANYTLDGRSDCEATIQVMLKGVHSVTHPGPVPAWLGSP